MKERAVRLRKIALAGDTLQLPPRLATGMPCTIREERRVQLSVE
jgi:hypothetical protein